MIGLFSLRFAKWAGAAGHVYCIEANPLCVYFLRANMARHGTRNFDILPVCMLDRSRLTEFTISYGNNLLGVAQDSPFSAKPGHHVHVESDSLDHLIASLRLRTPDFIKVDIEGAEGTAVAGCSRRLHGRARCSCSSCTAGPPPPRRWPISHRPATGITRLRADGIFPRRGMSDWFPEACLQVIGFPD